MKTKASVVAESARLKQWSQQIRECQNRPADLTIDDWCRQLETAVDTNGIAYHLVDLLCMGKYNIVLHVPVGKGSDYEQPTGNNNNTDCLCN